MTQAMTEAARLAEEAKRIADDYISSVSAHQVIYTAIEALAALASQPAGAGWQPIETAPKDGTAILGYWSGGRYDCAIHATKFHKGRWWEPNEDYPQCAPSHWQLLPDAPGIPARGQQEGGV